MASAVGISAAIGAGYRSSARHAAAHVTEQHALVVESLAGERARLARDLHDVVAHHVSLVAVRAESAPFVHPDLNDDARGVLAAIATDAREALTELRQVLVVLQRTSDEGERTPQPTACDVDDLVASAVAAGQAVTLDGEWRDVPPATGYVLYRAVQEGLTNARRHAPGVTARLSRMQANGAVGFRMTNPAERVAEPGRGLIGMRERVEALGGTMTAVMDDEEFVLEIQVPVVPR
nr:histidine kinase [Cellulomonas humilata]